MRSEWRSEGNSSMISRARVRAHAEGVRLIASFHTINYVKTPIWHPEVRALNGGRGVDHVIEVGGPDSFLQSLQAIRIGGQINMVGYLGSKHGAINPLEILYHRAQYAAFRSDRENRSRR
jgi:NADPH:quinone reductase-like Zn-dependent oxidoreductase